MAQKYYKETGLDTHSRIKQEEDRNERVAARLRAPFQNSELYNQKKTREAADKDYGTYNRLRGEERGTTKYQTQGSFRGHYEKERRDQGVGAIETLQSREYGGSGRRTPYVQTAVRPGALRNAYADDIVQDVHAHLRSDAYGERKPTLPELRDQVGPSMRRGAANNPYYSGSGLTGSRRRMHEDAEREYQRQVSHEGSGAEAGRTYMDEENQYHQQGRMRFQSAGGGGGGLRYTPEPYQGESERSTSRASSGGYSDGYSGGYSGGYGAGSGGYHAPQPRHDNNPFANEPDPPHWGSIY